MDDFGVLLFYSYSNIPDTAQHHIWHHALCQRLSLRGLYLFSARSSPSHILYTGRIRLAAEGLNGTVSGHTSDLAEYTRCIDETGLFPQIQWKKSKSFGHVFPSLRVELRPKVSTIFLPIYTFFTVFVLFFTVLIVMHHPNIDCEYGREYISATRTISKSS